MLVMTLESVVPRLRGKLTRWLVEIQAGVYVGRVNQVVRDLLWEQAIKLDPTGRITQAWSTNSDQGFDFRIHGDERRQVVEFDGLKFVANLNTKALGKIAPKRAPKPIRNRPDQKTG